MSSFSCPNHDPVHDYCLRLKTICVAGRPGCVLRGSSFAIPWEQRLREKEEERQREHKP